MIKVDIIRTKRNRFFSVAVSVCVFLSTLFLFHGRAFAGCSSVPEIMAKVTPCWFCPIFDIVFQAAGSYSYIAYTNVSGEAFSLLTICILFWCSGVMALVQSICSRGITTFVWCLFQKNAATTKTATIET